jgi:hypothetical protein
MLPKIFIFFTFIVFAVSSSKDACICPPDNIHILCNERTKINGNATYCDNFQCNYNILPPESTSNCPTTHYRLLIRAELRPMIDYLIFKVDGKPIHNFTAESEISTNYRRNFYFTATKNYTFEFHSGTSATPTKPTDNWHWSVRFDPMPSPIFDSVILNSISSKHVLWLPDMTKNQAIIIQNSDQTKILIMYSTFTKYSGLRNFAIYDGQNFDNFIQTLGDDSTTVLPNARSIKSSSKYFTIYASESIDSSNNGNTVLFTAEGIQNILKKK